MNAYCCTRLTLLLDSHGNKLFFMMIGLVPVRDV